MKVSLNWAQFYSNVNLLPQGGVDELVRKIGAQLGAVEEVIDVGQKYQGIVIAKVVSCEQHPNADKLKFCTIDDGGKIPDVKRNPNGHVEVVCGAPNVREGLLVAWLPPGTTVPSTFGRDPFILEAREIRGVVSNGMLASAQELDISNDHSGIVELDEGLPGDRFVEVFKLNDYIIDIENKMFTHRPDCFGQLGVAREIAGIEQQAFKSPDWYLEFDASSLRPETEQLPLEVKNELPELVPRFIAIPMSGIEIKPSPFWLQTYLSRVGIRPINNVVDLTNYYMMLTGQPLHAYDYDKLKALDAGDTATLAVRYPHEGEKITLLGGKEVTPRKEAIMIASAHKLIGIGGVMGGAETEVDDNTKNIVLECATFDLYSVRKTSMEQGLFTDAVTRFSKGQSPLQNDRIVAKVVQDIRELAGGKVAGELVDVEHNLSVAEPIQVTSSFVNDRLGLQHTAEDMARLLTNTEFEVTQEGETLTVRAPFWRRDIHIPEDVVEEVGRLYGYDHLPVELPGRTLEPPKRNPLLETKARVRDILSAAGANEVLTYSFVHGDLLAKVGQDASKAFQISNALSPDLQYYRLSLTPSLLERIHPNVKAGVNQCAMFEIGKIHSKEHLDEAGLPEEFERVALVFAADKKAAEMYHGAAYYQAQTYLTRLLEVWGIGEVSFEPLDPADQDQSTTYYAPGRAATIRAGDHVIGRIGEYKASVRKALKLPDFVAGFELGLGPLLGVAQNQQYQPLSKFPEVEQDICLETPATLSYQELYDFIKSKLQEVKPPDTTFSLMPLDIYQKEQNTKRTTYRLKIVSNERTLMGEEVSRLLDDVARGAGDAFGAERV